MAARHASESQHCATNTLEAMGVVVLAYLTIVGTAFAAYLGAPVWTALFAFVVLSCLSVMNIRALADSGNHELLGVDALTITREAFPHNALTAVAAYVLGHLTIMLWGTTL